MKRSEVSPEAAVDELLLYRGADYPVSGQILIHQPALDEICMYGEKEYYQMVITLCSVPADLKWQLWDMGIDYTLIDEFQLFYSFLSKYYGREQTGILFGDLDLQRFEPFVNGESKEVVMYNSAEDIVIDAALYGKMTDYLRQMHGLVKDEKKPANETTKQILIEDARDEYLRFKDREYHSHLRNLISAMVNSEGFKYNLEQVWNMKIYAFMDSVKRIAKIKNAGLLLESGYSGFGISLKEINKKELDWMGDLE
ncbi:hypothetical protein [Diplocloster modestus]|uniref:Uncharacterized protein n=1 Tax=Diplocloster modestus TaxID=2850322 RepID=A0ABS6KEI0_9FIRM|nr:hypothetical protein [Diplocloster modestus]MBU9728940.1 hypothetical protein [Diplocloster modestus]